ncbi:hypothetical protein PROFUN_16243 [Planoprotostelium fungivorum]|uniref:Uncharacterized protein n=1 Tax=Planoprotostelium fungivorum TaxID=1890364 RepID=A0A2P6MRA6_9EUKA|nr:hypothetical protein PROFUN_16243 [Planoprotostelium fungivorum]
MGRVLDRTQKSATQVLFQALVFSSPLGQVSMSQDITTTIQCKNLCMWSRLVIHCNASLEQPAYLKSVCQQPQRKEFTAPSTTNSFNQILRQFRFSSLVSTSSSVQPPLSGTTSDLVNGLLEFSKSFERTYQTRSPTSIHRTFKSSLEY